MSDELLKLAERDESAARCLRGYAKGYERLHRDVADDFERGAHALEERAAALRVAQEERTK